jgi:hypothetical protein
MIESLLDSVTAEKSTDSIVISPLVKSISGVAKISLDYDYKKDYAEFLAEKYK